MRYRTATGRGARTSNGTRPLSESVVLVTPRSFGAGDPGLRPALEAAVREVRYNDRGRPLRAAELREAMADVDGLLAGLDEIDASAIAAAPRLRVIARYGVGTSNVDLRAAARAGVVVTNTPGANAEAVAELTIGFIFALARSITRANQSVRAGHWHAPMGGEVAGKTLGILGLGKIGQAVARRAAGLGCTIVAYDPVPDHAFAARHQVRLAPREQVVAEAHFLTLHLPCTPQTRNLVDRRLLARMRPGSYLVNTARGELVVEEDLRRALESGHLHGAALDTLQEEPPPIDHPLLARDDVIVTPHIGASTLEAAATMGHAALHDLLAVLSGRPPRFPVTPIPGGSP
jgi:D-3-phosphoglycerate dehydrogenase / 2-oxoglutarate reductase